MVHKYIIFILLLTFYGCGNSSTSSDSPSSYNYPSTSSSTNATTEDVKSEVIDSVTRESVYKEQQKEIENVNDENITLAQTSSEKQKEIELLKDQNSEISQKLIQENLKYYYYGSKSDLFDKKILDKGDIFHRRNLNENITKSTLFSTDDSRTEFCVSSKIKKIYPDRAEDSYYINDECLFITDITRFWELTDVLIIETK